MTAICITSRRPTRSISSAARKGFTLVEILIVVIILGILAAIVIPQFTNASTSARQSNMASQDQTIKSQISLYSLQHNDQPPLVGSQGTDLFTQLTSVTDATGTSPPAAGVTSYGPYLQAVPTNPLTASTTVTTTIAPPFTLASPSGAGTAIGSTVGWVYVPATGEFHGVDAAGQASDTGY